MTKMNHEMPATRRVLDVGGRSKTMALPEFYQGWQRDLLSSDPESGADFACDPRQLGSTAPEVYDSVYCSHHLEHYFWHEVPTLLLGFGHLLKKDGFLFLAVPDIRALMKEVVARDLDLQDVLYEAPTGPVRVHDVFFGLGPDVERSGTDLLAHKCGFSELSLAQVLREQGFPFVFSATRGLDLWVIALRQEPDRYQRRLLGLP